MKTFPANCSDDEIRAAIVEWSECLSRGQYTDALALFLCATESMGFEWTPSTLADWISNYGCARADIDSGEYRTVTSLIEQPESDRFIRKAIQVDRENLYGLDPESYVGMVHYFDVPLDGEPSDLTARFNIKKLDETTIALEFLDIHVM